MLDVGEGEGDELGAAHGGGVADEDDRGVADPDRGGAVDAADDLADLVEVEWSSEASGCCAVGASQAPADLADGFGGDRVNRSGGAVNVPDHGAGHV